MRLSSPLTVLASSAAVAVVALPVAASGAEQQSAREILDASVKALAQVKTYHLEGYSADADGRTTLRGDLTADGRLRLALGAPGGTRVDVLETGAASFMRGNRRFWTSTTKDKQAAALLADRWVKLPASAREDLLGDLVAETTPKRLATCLNRKLGTLTRAGSTTVGGQKAVVLKDAGDKPGTEPGTIAIATGGKPLPLRLRQTGKAKAGGRFDATCDTKGDTSRAGEFVLSRFDRVVTIKAPKGALSLPEGTAPGGGGDTTET